MARLWRPQPVTGLAEGLVLFDGDCILCSGWVRFVVTRDRAIRFRFQAIATESGRTLARNLAINPDDPETNAVILQGMAWFKSDAALIILSELPGWRWIWALSLIPRSLRNLGYDCIARNRYRLFGRRTACLMPDADLLRHLMPEPEQGGTS